MGLLTKEVEMSACGNSNYYESKGYKLPKHFNKAQNKWTVIAGSKFIAKVEDLPLNSNIKIEAECDICKRKTRISYNNYNQNISRNNGRYICNHSHIEYENQKLYSFVIDEIKSFYNEYNKLPNMFDYTKENGFSFSYQKIKDVLKASNTDLLSIFSEIDESKITKRDINDYYIYLEKLKECVLSNPKCIKNISVMCRSKEYKLLNLPDIRWFINNCPDKSVKTIDDLKEYMGLFREKMNKEECTNAILKMSTEYDRPLKYDDFRGNNYGIPSILDIRTHWGTFNKMKTELGLEIIQPSMMDKVSNIDEVKFEIKRICLIVEEREHRYIITSSDFKKYNSKVSVQSMQKYLKQNLNTTVGEYVKSIGYDYVKSGSGMVYTYNDGETTASQFEYLFSNYLHSIGLVYNQDYFRNVKYKTIDKKYNGNMDCDYAIYYDDRTIYIEIAGILKDYKLYYQRNKVIVSSKSKEKYRQKLLEKENILKRNNCEYFILFPCDLTRDFLYEILNCDYKSTKEKIDKFYKNNIDWEEILGIGELRYNYSYLGRDKQPKVIYEKEVI